MDPLRSPLAAAAIALIASSAPVPRATAAPPAEPPPQVAALGDHVLLSWNDLGMHCMNKDHANFSVLPPYNNLDAQLILRGDALHLPQRVTAGVTLEYSFPGNSYSVGKTDFWSYAGALFGVVLPPDVGLAGKGLTGTMDLTGPRFRAEGIPLTPFPDATPSEERAYQQALVIARDAGGIELARSAPVAPVSVELSCVSSGCHASEDAILEGHPRAAGFDPAARPILCADCHADPVLGTAGIVEAGYFSFRMHDQHKFMDQLPLSGTALCYKCHPGAAARCLRGVMANRFGLVCQDCHGGMAAMASSIEGGRVPWVNEPACRDCHTTRFGEPVGQLYRQSTGHGGVMCEGCHNSTHAEWSSAVAADNANILGLQGTAGPLADCRVCHGVSPSGPGPHGMLAVGVEDEVLKGADPLRAWPNPTHSSCRLEVAAGRPEGGHLVILDLQGRTVCVLRPRASRAGVLAAEWDGRDAHGRRVARGTYLARWTQEGRQAATRITVLD